MTLVDLGPFNAKVKFGHLGFCMGKSKKIILLLLLICGLRSQSLLEPSTILSYEAECIILSKMIVFFVFLGRRSTGL